MIALLVGGTAGCFESNPLLPDSASASGEETGNIQESASTSTSGPMTSATATASPSAATGTTGVESESGAGPRGTTSGLNSSSTSSEGSDSTGRTEAESSSTNGEQQCGGDNLCVPVVPNNWVGPALLFESDSAGSLKECPDEAPATILSAFAGLEAEQASCDCDCGTPTDTSCGPVVLEYFGGDPICGGPALQEYPLAAEGSCLSLLDYPSGHYWDVPNPGVVGGECSPMPTTEVPAASWATHSVLCGEPLFAEGSCPADEQCVADLTGSKSARVCIAQEGTHECPSGGFTDRFVRFESFTDTRACSECSCESPTGTCGGTVSIWSQLGCSDSPVAFASLHEIGAGCEASAFGADSAYVSFSGSNDTSCAPSTPSSTGDAQAGSPTTLCCLPE